MIKNKVPVILIIVNITITKCSRMATIYFYGGHPWEGVDAHHANVAKDNWEVPMFSNKLCQNLLKKLVINNVAHFVILILSNSTFSLKIK